MTEEEIKQEIKSTIEWLLQNGTFENWETAYNCAMNSINMLDEALLIPVVVRQSEQFYCFNKQHKKIKRCIAQCTTCQEMKLMQ